ncbi:MAG: tetratricopeptide repeat protein, partial [Leptolyngbya sp. SIO3F4]|nr:tetratricopeptide repeat protein [Leptolyngbya sp. SIO3F4]
MGQQSRSGWLTWLIKQLLARWSRVWSRLRGRRRVASVLSQSPVPATVATSSPPTQTQVEQTLIGDRNVGIGVVETGAQVMVTHGAAPLPTGEPNPFGVPYPRNPYFTGRQTALKQLHQQLHSETTAAITQVAISGLGGIGKTQTAVEYAYRYHYDEQVYDTVLWVKAETEAALATDFANITRQLALPVAQCPQEEQIPAVRAWLANHAGWLLIFDNADHPEWLLPFLPQNPQGRILLTSRASVFDEIGAEPLVLEVLSLAEACDLLFTRTGYERTEENQTAATAINQELDGLPLALEQAAAFMVHRRVSLPLYLRTYRKRGLSQLEEARAKTGQYPSSVLRTWALNVQAISEEQPAAIELFKFSAFLAPDEIPYRLWITGSAHFGEQLAGYLQKEDADEIILALSQLLEALSQYSLIKWISEREAYSIHRLVQAVTRDELDVAEQTTRIRQVIEALKQADPGSDFQQWPQCAQLLPHWLQVFEQTQRASIKSEALGFMLNQAGFFLKAQGRYGEAEPLYKAALAMRKLLFGSEHPAVAHSLNNLATLYESQGRYEEAEPLYRKALATRRRLRSLFSGTHPAVRSLNNQAGFFLQDQGVDGEAEIAQILNNLAGLYDNQGRYGKAEPLYEQALEMRKRLLGDNHPDVAASLNNLARLYTNQGRDGEAEPLYQRALAMNKRLLGETHPAIAVSLNNLAGLYTSQERYGEAEPLYQQALAMNKRLLGEIHPAIAVNLNNLAGLYTSQGRYGESEPLYQQ